MVDKIRLYQTDVENFKKKFGTYFSNAKALNSDPRVKAGMTILGMIGGYTVNGFSGIIAGKDIANEIYYSQSNEKEIEKTRFQNIMKEFSDVYYNCDRFFELVNDIDRINRISNYPVEMVILDDAPFLKISPLAQKELAIAKE